MFLGLSLALTNSRGVAGAPAPPPVRYVDLTQDLEEFTQVVTATVTDIPPAVSPGLNFSVGTNSMYLPFFIR